MKERGTANGTTTDIDGNFSITVADSAATLTVDFVGFSQIVVPVNGRTQIDITMQENETLLEQVVVVGYGTQKKSDLTGAVGSVKAKDIERIPAASVDQALQGKIAGVYVLPCFIRGARNVVLDRFDPASLLQASSLNNTDDGDLFWQGNNFGQGNGGYNGRGTFTAGEWHRVVAAYDMAANPPVVVKYVDGIKQDEWTANQGLDNPRRALQPTAILFGDGDQDERRVFYVNSVQIRSGRLSDAEIAYLGGPSAGGSPGHIPRTAVTGQWDFEFADLSATMRNHKALRYMVNPANSVYALGRLAVQRGVRPAAAAEAIGADAAAPARRADGKPPLLMLVIGETARADHFSLNGYERATNPQLAKLDVVFRCKRTQEVRAMDPRLYEQLSRLQDHFGKARATVISGFRFAERSSSRHFHASAIDIRLEGVGLRDMYQYAQSLDGGGMGMGIYPHSNFIHVDYRAPGEPSYRWTDYSGPGSSHKAKGKRPGVLIVHEWWGLNDHIRSLVDRFASAGFVTLAFEIGDGLPRTAAP